RNVRVPVAVDSTVAAVDFCRQSEVHVWQSRAGRATLYSTHVFADVSGCRCLLALLRNVVLEISRCVLFSTGKVGTSRLGKGLKTLTKKFHEHTCETSNSDELKSAITPDTLAGKRQAI